MSVTHDLNIRLPKDCINHSILNFLIMNTGPDLGHFSVGEFNVIR
jgi:hypothetical protein